jgi:hypothetical protein
MIAAWSGIFGWVAPSAAFFDVLAPLTRDLQEMPT